MVNRHMSEVTQVSVSPEVFDGFYRPQQSCGKEIFSEACVKNSVHRGGLLSQHALRVVSQHALQGGLPLTWEGGV